MNKDTWKKIKYYRDKYKDTPNGWALALMIGNEYETEASRVSNSKRRKLGKRSKETA